MVDIQIQHRKLMREREKKKRKWEETDRKVREVGNRRKHLESLQGNLSKRRQAQINNHIIDKGIVESDKKELEAKIERESKQRERKMAYQRQYRANIRNKKQQLIKQKLMEQLNLTTISKFSKHTVFEAKSLRLHITMNNEQTMVFSTRHSQW